MNALPDRGEAAGAEPGQPVTGSARYSNYSPRARVRCEKEIAVSDLRRLTTAAEFS
jgi:hypothetical protein